MVGYCSTGQSLQRAVVLMEEEEEKEEEEEEEEEHIDVRCTKYVHLGTILTS